MERAAAIAILDRLHAAQNEFYGGGRMHRRDVLTGEGTSVAALTDGTAVTAGVERRWSTVGLYDIPDGARISSCWLLPLDQSAFDEIWSA